MAAAVSSSSSSARAATTGSSAPSPSTATARATAVQSAGSRRSRISTMLETAREPIALTVSACDASGRTPSTCRARSSWRSSSGLPAVVRWQAGDERSCAASPSRSRTSWAVALRPERAGVDRDRGVVLGQLGEQALVLVRLAGAQGGDDQHRQPLEPAEQEGQAAQRAGVAPLHVVDREHERPLGRQVDGQPVEAVQHGERAVGRGRPGRARASCRTRRRRPRAADGRGPASSAARRSGSAEQRPRRAGGRRRSRSRAPAGCPGRSARARPRRPPCAVPPAAAGSCRSRPGRRSAAAGPGRPARRRAPRPSTCTSRSRSTISSPATGAGRRGRGAGGAAGADGGRRRGRRCARRRPCGRGRRGSATGRAPRPPARAGPGPGRRRARRPACSGRGAARPARRPAGARGRARARAAASAPRAAGPRRPAPRSPAPARPTRRLPSRASSRCSRATSRSPASRADSASAHAWPMWSAKRRPAPQREGPVEQPVGVGGRLGGAGLQQQPLELARRRRPVVGAQRVAGALPGDDALPVARAAGRLQPTAQVGDVGLQRAGRARRGVVAPQRVDHPVGRHDVAARQDQQAEDRALPRAAEVDHGVGAGPVAARGPRPGGGRSSRPGRRCAAATGSPRHPATRHPTRRRAPCSPAAPTQPFPSPCHPPEPTLRHPTVACRPPAAVSGQRDGRSSPTPAAPRPPLADLQGLRSVREQPRAQAWRGAGRGAGHRQPRPGPPGPRAARGAAGRSPRDARTPHAAAPGAALGRGLVLRRRLRAGRPGRVADAGPAAPAHRAADGDLAARAARCCTRTASAASSWCGPDR